MRAYGRARAFVHARGASSRASARWRGDDAAAAAARARGLAVPPHPLRLQACARGGHSMAHCKGQP